LRARAGLAVQVAAIHLLVVAPLYVRHFLETGSIFSPGLSGTLFVAKYEEIFSYGSALSWQSLRAELGIRRIVEMKLEVAGFNLTQFANFLDPVVTLLLAASLLELLWLGRREELRSLYPALIFFGLAYAFYSFLWTIHGPGSFYKGLAALMPFIALAVLGFFQRHAASARLAGAAALVLAAYTGYVGYQAARQFSLYYDQVYGQYSQISAIIGQDAAAQHMPPGSIVVMTREPWDLNAATGLKAVMIPDNDLDTIYAVAQHYSAGYLLLPAPRPALDKVYSGLTPDPRFMPLATVPATDWKIYRIAAGVPAGP
jgi:hypothetical protein